MFTRKLKVKHVRKQDYYSAMNSILKKNGNKVLVKENQLCFKRFKILKESISSPIEIFRRVQYMGTIEISADQKTILLEINFKLQLILIAIASSFPSILIYKLRNVDFIYILFSYLVFVFAWYLVSIYKTLSKFQNYLIEPFMSDRKM